MAKPLERALKEEKIERELAEIERYFKYINTMCKVECGLNLFDFLAERERLKQQAMMYSVGPYKKKAD